LKSLVIIPTYNEIENVEIIIRSIFSLKTPFEILIIDDGSPDKTADKVKELQDEFNSKHKRLHLIEREEKLGLGTAYLKGFEFALAHNYNYVFEMDADFSHDPKDLKKLLRAARVGGNDLVIGSRYIEGVNVVNWPLGRVLLSYIASLYTRVITGMPVHDATAGFKCYKIEVLQTIDLSSIKFVGYAFQIEMKFNAWKHGFKIKEIPIVFTDRVRGDSKMSIRIFNEALFGVIQMKLGSLFKKYKKVNQTVSTV
jgi:dolichol-phosphate mannosyltransferase